MGIYQNDYLQEERQGGEVGYNPKKANLELLKKYAAQVDISTELDEGFLRQLAEDLIKQVSSDDQTRDEWMDKYNETLEIARQKITVKEYPFEHASDVKVPLILQGCVQFNARVMPEIIQNNKTVYAACAGNATPEDEASAQRLSQHMSLQTMKTVENWVSDTDKMLIALPLVGTVFRKWSYDPISRKPACNLCLPTEIIVSNDISSIEKAERITHVMRMSRNEMIERIRFGIFNEKCLDELQVSEETNINQDTNYSSDDDDKELPSNVLESKDNYVLWEVSTYLDLDDDGYCEPYTVTLVRKTKQIARIAPRFDERDFVMNADGDLVRINANNYYSAHHFLPSPDGTFLGMGFGQILLQLNKAINSVTNQLVDAGTLSNMPGGLISKDLRMRKGELQFSAGEFKIVNHSAMMGPLSNFISNLPFKEPSQTLMSLLQFLVDFGKQTANISDILMGNPSSANMPATSVVSMIEQGSKVFSSILTRLYESFRKEFTVLFNLNKKYLPLYPEKDLMTQSGFIQQQDYDAERFNIYPVANPAVGMDAVRLAKFQVVMQMQTPFLQQGAIIMDYLKALGFSDEHLKKWATPPEQLKQPSPQELLMQAQIEELKARTQEIGMRAAKIMRDGDLDAIKIELDERRLQKDASYQGGQLAIGKANAIAAITAAESRAIGNQANAAKAMVDSEAQTTGIPVDLSDIDAKIGQIPLSSGQNSANVGQNEQGNVAPGGQAPSMSVQNAPNLPPELDAMLQNIAAQQKQ